MRRGGQAVILSAGLVLFAMLSAVDPASLVFRHSKLAFFQYTPTYAFNTNAGGGGITLTQHNTNTGTPLTSITAGSSTTTGNMMCFAVEANSNSVAIPISSISDTSGATWQKGAQITAGSSPVQDVEIWCAKNITGHAAPVVTPTFGAAATYTAFYFSEWHGASTAGNTNGTGSATGTSASAATGNFTVAVNQLTLGICIMGNGSVVQGSGFTKIDTDTFSVYEYQIAASTTANVTCTGTSSTWPIVGASYP